MIWTILGISAISGFLGRLGGKEGFDTKCRDLGVSGAIVALCALFGQIRGIPAWLSLIPCFLLMFGALTTYKYFLPKPKDYQWWHYSMHAFFISLAMFPLMFFTGHWAGLFIRCVINAILVGIWSRLFAWSDDLNEGGRYFLITVTTPILFLI